MRAGRKGKPGSPHVRRNYSILRRERAKGCVIQAAKAGADFGRVQLRGIAESGRELEWRGTAFWGSCTRTAQLPDYGFKLASDNSLDGDSPNPTREVGQLCHGGRRVWSRSGIPRFRLLESGWSAEFKSVASLNRRRCARRHNMGRHDNAVHERQMKRVR